MTSQWCSDLCLEISYDCLRPQMSCNGCICHIVLISGRPKCFFNGRWWYLEAGWLKANLMSCNDDECDVLAQHATFLIKKYEQAEDWLEALPEKQMHLLVNHNAKTCPVFLLLSDQDVPAEFWRLLTPHGQHLTPNENREEMWPMRHIDHVNTWGSD